MMEVKGDQGILEVLEFGQDGSLVGELTEVVGDQMVDRLFDQVDVG